MLPAGNNGTTPNLTLKHTLSKEEKLDILRTINDEEAYNLLPVFITCGILMFVGIVGNSLVVYVYWKKMRHSAKRTFILALAWLDLSACLIVIPCEMYDLRNQVLFTQDELCRGMRFLEYSTVLSAGFVLISVSFERYYYLCKAFEEFSSKKAKYVCLICVVCGMIVSLPSAIFAGSKSRHFPYYPDLSGSECSLNSEHNLDEILKRVYYYFLLILFIGCVIVFVVIYSMIGRLFWKYQSGRCDPTNMEPGLPGLSKQRGSGSSLKFLKNLVTADQNSDNSHCSRKSAQSGLVHQTHSKRSIKSSGTVIIFFSVTIVFVLSFLPHLVMRLIKFLDIQLGYDRDTFELLYNFTVRSYMISNAANPFIYSILNKSFRKELKRTFRTCGPCNRDTDYLGNGNLESSV